eukprot:CAMPEP_0117443622 /NCGR_PEP_ID=MMETSP0759-20121206/4791_1 /TAXON_ID=63605 /ORGANISM="Percolomonas cosmopolitus, Strain WS" /LENGTH=352 /DNA_ID=CAMNT_0005235605 /DNA_START=2528 /DNA_END=3586 /DNA_ORIENTATION=+
MHPTSTTQKNPLSSTTFQFDTQLIQIENKENSVSMSPKNQDRSSFSEDTQLSTQSKTQCKIGKKPDLSCLREADVVGGHDGEIALASVKVKASPLTDGEFFLKPVLKEKERKFYEEFLQETQHGDEHFARMVQDWIPTYYRTETINNMEYLVMQNLCSGFSKPCILDLKMGVQTYDDDASEKKKAYEISKYPDQATQGFRITGFKQVVPKEVFEQKFGEDVQNAVLKEKEVIVKTKKWKNGSYNSRKVRKVLKRFFNPYSDCSKDMWPLFEPKMKQFLHVMQNQRSFRFIASSLLFIYEGDPESEAKTALSVIDFAHVHRIEDQRTIDHGYVKGIQTILKYMNEEVEEEENS